MSHRGRILIGAVAVLLAAACLVALRARAMGDGSEWALVDPGDLVLGVELEGELEAAEATFLSPPAIPRQRQFRIAFLAPEGSRVQAGQPVLAFDTSELDTQLQERIADRDSAAAEIERRGTDLAKRRSEVELQLAEARAELKKTALDLEVPEDLVGAKELEALRIDRAVAEERIEYLEERLDLVGLHAAAELRALADRRDRAGTRVDEIRDHLGRMRRVAPRDGVVIYATDWTGEKPKVGDTIWRGNPVLQVPDLDRLRAAARIDEADVAAVVVGQRVTLRLDAHPDREIPGHVAEIARTVQRRSPREPAKVVRVTVELDAVEPELMRPGMRLRGRIETERVEEVLTVPAAAVTNTPGGPVVYRRSGFGHELVRPELGRRSAERVEILSGLQAGDRVALGIPPGAGEAEP